MTAGQLTQTAALKGNDKQRASQKKQVRRPMKLMTAAADFSNSRIYYLYRANSAKKVKGRGSFLNVLFLFFVAVKFYWGFFLTLNYLLISNGPVRPHFFTDRRQPTLS